MSACGCLGIERLAVDRYIKHAFGPGGERQRLDDVLIVGEKICCRAHGAGRIVSGDAVSDVDDVHWDLSPNKDPSLGPDIENADLSMDH